MNHRIDLRKGRIKELRRTGYATGSVCGRDVESVSVEVKLHDLINEMKNSSTGLKSLFELDINGAPEGSNGTVIIKNIVKDPISRKILDIQFQRVSMLEKVQVGVAIELVGVATASNRDGGMIEQTLEELQVLCLPSGIPTKIEVDISGLGIGDQITVADLKLQDGVEAVSAQDSTIVISRAPSVRRGTEEAATE